MGNQTQMNVQLNESDRRSCPCGGKTFVPAFGLFNVSAILSPNGQAGVVVMQDGFVCADCGLPADMEPKTDDPKIQLVGGVA